MYKPLQSICIAQLFVFLFSTLRVLLFYMNYGRCNDSILERNILYVPITSICLILWIIFIKGIDIKNKKINMFIKGFITATIYGCAIYLDVIISGKQFKNNYLCNNAVSKTRFISFINLFLYMVNCCLTLCNKVILIDDNFDIIVPTNSETNVEIIIDIEPSAPPMPEMPEMPEMPDNVLELGEIKLENKNNIMEEYNGEIYCSICIDESDKSKQVKLMCNHTFHEKCILSWFIEYKKKSCPLCRKS